MLRFFLLSFLASAVAATAVVAVFGWRWSRAIESEMRDLVATASPVGTIVTAEMVAALPAPAQRFLHNAGVLGKPIPSLVRLKQKGRMRGSPSASWMPFEAEQVYTIDPPGFVWRASFPKRSLPVVFGRDFYANGDGGIAMKALGIWPVASLQGGELGQAGLMRFLNEMMWFPAAYLGPNVNWETIDDRSAKVSITDRGLTAVATLFFDEEGNIENFRALRYDTNTRRTATWETPLGRHGMIAGLTLPLEGQGVWKFPEGDFAYIELEITELTYE